MIIYVDISNLLYTSFITGIQRVVREVLSRMQDDSEFELLAYDFSKDCFLLVDKQVFFDKLKKGVIDREKCITNNEVKYTDLQDNSIFFDIDGVWHSTKNRGYLYPVLAQKGIKIINMIYDVIPITGPIFCHENTVMSFMVYFGAVIKYSTLIIVNAQATKDHIIDIASELNVEMPRCEVIKLGADFGSEKKQYVEGNASQKTKKAISAGKYILMVGTIEPRKNHAYVLDALDRNLSVNVIFAGRQGWNVDELVERIESHKQNGKRLFWINDASDDDIQELYRNAYYVVFPTKDEGFGLPIIEAVTKGIPVIGSNIPVVKELGEDYIQYIDNTNPQELVDLINGDTELNRNSYLQKMRNFPQYTWDKCVGEIKQVIADC